MTPLGWWFITETCRRVYVCG